MSRFSLSSDCRRQLIWRESGTAYRPENIQEKDRYPTCSIMVWAGIMINGRTRLHVVANGTMTGQRYIDEVLLPHVRLFRGAVGDKFVFMADNATCHRTLAVQDCLDSEGIQRLVWPARSPDLNPIENVWMLWGGKLLVETILRQTRTPSSVHSQRNGINCLNSCWIMLCKLKVSEELGIAQSVISRLWQRFQDDGNVSRCYSTGHPRVTTPNEDRYLAVTAKRNRRSTASDLSRQLSSGTGATVSRQTMYRRLGHIGLYARLVCSLILAGLWRAPGTRYHQENTIERERERERHRYGGAGWLVWGGIILGSRTDLHVHSVTMTGHINRDVILECLSVNVILEQHVRLFRGAMGAEFLFMDDNARPHCANIVDERLQLEDITRVDRPAYSPDLNPIEHVWNMLGRRILTRQPPPTCLLETSEAIA
ncbi:transposable element Tcb1 transposase [Trichonephila clavipes]|nr:transposable element Tcb1 transposase [Trichonephila clavipes]